MRKEKKGRVSRTVAVRRALLMLQVLQESDTSGPELIAAVERELGKDAYGGSPQDSFEKDKQFLKGLGIKFKYEKRQNLYQLQPESPALVHLCLRPEEIDVLPMLQQAFAATPYAETVMRLVKRVQAHLPAEMQRREPSNPLLSVVIASADSLAPHAATIRTIIEAIKLHRLLEFDYHSPRTERTISHIAQPYDTLEYRDGHLYFEAHNLKWDRTLEYRVDRIVPNTIRRLPQKFAEGKRTSVMLPLRYRLTAKIARYGASRRFPEQSEEKQADDSVIVTAKIAKDDLFWASKILLKYGENCTVIEPPELVAEMKRVAQEMARNYGLGACRGQEGLEP